MTALDATAQLLKGWDIWWLCLLNLRIFVDIGTEDVGKTGLFNLRAFREF